MIIYCVIIVAVTDGCRGHTSCKARESHLLRSFKTAVKSCNEQEAVQLTVQLTTTRARLQVSAVVKYSYRSGHSASKAAEKHRFQSHNRRVLFHKFISGW